MSHDIRTPMNVITGMAEIAAAHIGDQDRVKDCLQKIRLSSHHLLGLINDVLNMSKIENGNFLSAWLQCVCRMSCRRLSTSVLPASAK